jgi:hypothetical protein
MRCAGKSNPIADDIWPARFHGPDMCRRDFSAPSSIDKLQTGDGAALIIGTQHNTPKDSITQNPGYGYAGTVALLVKSKWRLLLVQAGQWHVVVEPRQQGDFFLEAEFEYSVEITREIGRTAD